MLFFPREGVEGLIQELVYLGVEKHNDLVVAFTMVLYMISRYLIGSY